MHARLPVIRYTGVMDSLASTCASCAANGTATCTSCGFWSGYNPWGFGVECLMIVGFVAALGFGTYGLWAVGYRLLEGEWPWDAI